MSQQSIFARVTNLARANIHAMLDGAEDPEKMMDQMIRDYTSNIQEAEQAVAQTLGNLRMLEDDAKEIEQSVDEWGKKAAAAMTRSQQMAAEGRSEEATRFENLARVALSKQVELEQQLSDMRPNIETQSQVVENLRTGLERMKDRLAEIKRRRDELVARARVVEAQSQVNDALKAVDVHDPLSEVSRFEEKIRREEAKVRGQTELAASSLDAQFESLEALTAETEVEARLAALRGGGTG